MPFDLGSRKTGRLKDGGQQAAEGRKAWTSERKGGSSKSQRDHAEVSGQYLKMT